MLDRQNTLLCVFSYNMGPTLDRCIQSMRKMCPGFEVILIDDQSDDAETQAVITRNSCYFSQVFRSTAPKQGKKHGNLYENIQWMCDYATERGFEYLFMIQDDMQFVRAMDEKVCREYHDLFLSSDKVIQVDPRFLRKGYEYDLMSDIKAYAFAAGDPRRSFAAVGIISLSILKMLNWKFLESEPANKKALTELGYVRLFPFTPIFMHVPFPIAYRNGKRRNSWLPGYRGSYAFHEMTDREQKVMDSRPLSEIPYFRTLLRPSGMYLARVVYWVSTDNSVLR
jgi:glycosyltransferase involved in cell wall biosynthesis